MYQIDQTDRLDQFLDINVTIFSDKLMPFWVDTEITVECLKQIKHAERNEYGAKGAGDFQ